MGLIKDVYSPSFYDRFSNVLIKTIPSFDKVKFIEKIFDDNFISKEYKERMKHTTSVLHQFLPAEFGQSVRLIKEIINKLQEENFKAGGIEFMFFPDYIETYGLDDFEISVNAFEFITQFVSCEFAVRPFVIKYGERMIKQMERWSKHKSAGVRRLATEGSRPRLPWAMAIPALKKDPTPLIPILENLKNDPSESVRRSVANNLNDIAKDNPQIVLELATKWKGQSKETDAIIKHGSRTLLKQGHTEILSYFDLKSEQIDVTGFKVLTPQIKIGDSLAFTFSVTNNNAVAKTVRLEYAVFYKKQNGDLSKKVFKISERIFQPNEKADIIRKQRFTIITTRTFYVGRHQLSIIVNGQEKGIATFELLAA
jgi:3-methyladenine DNA glycosylase AlkC